MVLAQVEFAYNNFVNRSIEKIPFEIVTRMHPRGVTNLRDVSSEGKRSTTREEFVDFMESLHKEVKLRMEETNQNFKENANKSSRHHVFKFDDEVVVHLKKGRFLVETYSKLVMNKLRPCKILRKFDNGNAYEVELLDDMDISPIFNVVDLYDYHKLDDEFFISNNYSKKQIEEVEQILDQRFGKSTRGKDYYENFLN